MRGFIVAKRLIKQILGDKRSIGLMFVAPVLILFLLYTIFTSSTTEPKINVVDVPDSFVQLLDDKTQVKKVATEKEAIENLKSQEADAYIIYKNNKPEITLEGTNPTVNKMVLSFVQKTLFETMSRTMKENLQKFQEKLQQIQHGFLRGVNQGTVLKPPALELPKLNLNVAEPVVHYYYGSEDSSTFDFLAPLLMGFFIFFFVFLIAGISFLRERLTGTLDRVLATPLRRFEIVLGYLFGFGLFVAIQTVIIQLFIIYGLEVPMEGNPWLVLLINLLLATVALSFGTFLSAYARNEFQLFQFIPIAITPQVLFSGMFDLTEAPQWVIVLSKIFPLTYGAEALKNVMIRGLGLEFVQKELLILVGYAVVFLVLNTLALKKYRKV
jgi:ABC-2 type transport system permease protein